MEHISKALQQAQQELKHSNNETSPELPLTKMPSEVSRLLLGSEEGVSLSRAIGGNKVSPTAFRNAAIRMTGAYSADYVGVKGSNPTPDQVKWRELCQQVLRLGWTEEEFNARVDTFIAENPWGTWKVAEFINGAKLPKIYPHSWYVARCAEAQTNAEAIGCYRLPDHEKPVFGWKHDVGAVLPPWQVAEPTAKALPPAEKVVKPVSENTEQLLATVKEKLRLQCQVEEQEQLIDRLRKELDKLQQSQSRSYQTITEQATKIAELQGFEQGYLDMLELLVLTEELEQMDPDSQDFQDALEQFTSVRSMHLSSYRDQWGQEELEERKAA